MEHDTDKIDERVDALLAEAAPEGFEWPHESADASHVSGICGSAAVWLDASMHDNALRCSEEDMQTLAMLVIGLARLSQSCRGGFPA